MIKQLLRMVFRRQPRRSFVVPRSSYDYASQVKDGTGSSTVMAPLLWIARTFPEAPIALWTQVDGQEDRVHDHPFLRLLHAPNPHYTGPILWQATLTDFEVDGNAYWLKIRNRAGAVKELWWAPHWTIEPKSSEDTYITHYEYRTGTAGRVVELDSTEVIHFRFGLDPDDPRKGYSPLKSVLREVFTDDEAANFTASLLRNMGVPGLIVSPEGDFTPSAEDVEATKAYMKSKFAGDSRGEAIIMSGPTKVQQFGFSPNELSLRDLRRLPEERVTAVLAVPAMVAGLGAGLDRSTFTNFREARTAAYEQAIIPAQRLFGEDLRFQLLSDFESSVFAWRVGFDLAKVRALAEDEDKLMRRLDVGVRGGWIPVQYAQRVAGVPIDPGANVYLRQANIVQVPVDGTAPVALSSSGKANK